MDASSPDLALRRAILPRALLVGGALGVVALAGAGLVLYDADGSFAGATGLLITLLLALAVGIWAGAPEAEREVLPLREHWLAAGISIGMAGVFAGLWSTLGELSGGVFGRVLALLLLVAGPVYLLGLLLPVLFVWAERREEECAEEGEVGWGALGYMIVGLLGGTAAGVVFAGLLSTLVAPGPLLMVTAVALLAPVAFPELKGPVASEELLYENATPFGTVGVVEVVYPGERQPERRLLLNGEEESGELVRSGAPTLAYIAAAERWLAGVAPGGGAYLFLGGGAYTLPRRIAERDPKARITVVELDPEITRVAYRYFGLHPKHGIGSVHGDARAFVERAGAAGYDRIYLDVYGGQEALPYSLVTREAFEDVRRCLRPAGLVALNLIGVTEGAEGLRFWSIVRTFAEVFPAVALYTHLGRDYPERQNVLLAGSADPNAVFPEHAGLFEHWPRAEWPAWEETVVFRDLFPAAVQQGAARPS